MGWEDTGQLTCENIQNVFKMICTPCCKLLPSFHVLFTGVGWEDKGPVTVEDFQNVCKVTCTCTSCKLLPSFPGNVLCTGLGWEGKGKSLLRISEMSVKHHVPPAAFFSLLSWSAEMNYPSDYSFLCLHFQKTEIQRKPRKR